MSSLPKADSLVSNKIIMPKDNWFDAPFEFKKGNYSYGSKPQHHEALDLPNPRKWSPEEQDWQLPENWKEILLEGLRERLDKYRSLRLFMDVCVRCGACADKCHFFIGSGDPKNMPFLRAELLRSVYRREFTKAGKIMGKIAGARDLTENVVKEWFFYFFQCSECRRCSVFCPFGIDTAEITIIARELLGLLGVNTDWTLASVSNCFRVGNHVGIQPHAVVDTIDMLCDDIEDITGVRVNPTFNRKGAEVLFIAPSGDFFADPGIYTFMGYLMLFHEIRLDYTLSTYASEGGNFGSFVSHEMMKRLNAKMFAEAKRLGVKWILGGECGHMWRVVNQYMDTMNGPADFLEVPVSPITGTRFENTISTKMVHITEFTSDLIRHNKLKLDPRRNDDLKVTYHDSCNPARSMGIFEEPRYIINNVCRNFYEMPENTIREKTYCCGSGSGLNNEEFMEMRMRGGFPRASAVKHVKEKHDVNMLSCICALDRAAMPALMRYWNPGVEVCGVHELLGNALIMKDEGDRVRETNLRGEPIEVIGGEQDV